MSLVLIKYILLAAIRDRLVWGVAAISILGVCLSVFSGAAAIMEQGQFVLAYMAGSLRILVLLGLALFTVFFVRRSFDARDVEFLLTRPITRGSFVVSHSVAFCLLSIAGGFFISMILMGMSFVFAAQSVDVLSLFLWCFGITFEFMIVANVAFFFAMVLSSPVTAGLATFGFYILARLMGQLLAIFHHAPIPNDVGSYILSGLGQVINLIAIVIPRLDLLAQTSWLIYGGGVLSDWIFVLCQGVAFVSLIVISTLFDLRRRQF